jgi:predicted flap endonuclease-1-like 5' DNA nuclease
MNDLLRADLPGAVLRHRGLTTTNGMQAGGGVLNIWGLLALIFAGAFFALLIIVIFYWRTVRPRLLMLIQQPTDSPSPALPAVDERFYEAVRALNEALVRHSALVARLPGSFAVRAPDTGETDPALLSAIEAFQREQAAVLARLEREVESLSGPAETQTEEGQQATLEDVRGLITTLNERNLNISAVLTQQSSALSSLVAHQTQDTDRLDALQQQLTGFINRQKAAEHLQDIKGIGAVYAERLQAAGIMSFDQLVRYTPDQLREIVQAPKGLRVNTASWIDQARAYLTSARHEAEDQT